MLEAGVTLAGRYEIQKQLGRGGHSHVFLAYDTVSERNRAIKEIDKSSDSRLDAFARREAEAVRELKYPYFPEIYDILEMDGKDYLIMEYLPGETAGERLRRLGPQPPGEVARWGRDLCLMLSYLHQHTPPMVYCDMKPDNIMVQPEGNLRLIDFGAVWRMQNDEAGLQMLGTRGYAAPEQIDNWKAVDARTDIYGLGMTMYQLVTGEDPCQSDTEGTIGCHMRRSVPRRFARIIRKCTEEDPNKRYPSCESLREELDKITGRSQ